MHTCIIVGSLFNAKTLHNLCTPIMPDNTLKKIIILSLFRHRIIVKVFIGNYSFRLYLKILSTSIHVTL
jgi:hypothetical protein